MELSRSAAVRLKGARPSQRTGVADTIAKQVTAAMSQEVNIGVSVALANSFAHFQHCLLLIGEELRTYFGGANPPCLRYATGVVPLHEPQSDDVYSGDISPSKHFI